MARTKLTSRQSAEARARNIVRSTAAAYAKRHNWSSARRAQHINGALGAFTAQMTTGSSINMSKRAGQIFASGKQIGAPSAGYDAAVYGATDRRPVLIQSVDKDGKRTSKIKYCPVSGTILTAVPCTLRREPAKPDVSNIRA